MSNLCGHTHFCIECKWPYVCWNPECINLEYEVALLCPECSYEVWVKSKGTPEAGVCQ